MECPVCGEGTLKKQVTSAVFEYKGHRIIVNNYITYNCNICGESIVDNDSLKLSSALLNKFKRVA